MFTPGPYEHNESLELYNSPPDSHQKLPVNTLSTVPILKGDLNDVMLNLAPLSNTLNDNSAPTHASKPFESEYRPRSQLDFPSVIQHQGSEVKSTVQARQPVDMNQHYEMPLTASYVDAVYDRDQTSSSVQPLQSTPTPHSSIVLTPSKHTLSSSSKPLTHTNIAPVMNVGRLSTTPADQHMTNRLQGSPGYVEHGYIPQPLVKIEPSAPASIHPSTFLNYQSSVSSSVQHSLSKHVACQERLNFMNNKLYDSLHQIKHDNRVDNVKKYEDVLREQSKNRAMELISQDLSQKLGKTSARLAHLETQHQQDQDLIARLQTQLKELQQESYSDRLRGEASVLNIKRLQKMYDDECQDHTRTRFESSQDVAKAESYFAPQLATLHAKLAAADSTITDLHSALKTSENRRERLEAEGKSLDERLELLLSEKNEEIADLKRRIAQLEMTASEQKIAHDQESTRSYHRGLHDGAKEGHKDGVVEGEIEGRKQGEEIGFSKGKLVGYKAGYEEGESHGRCVSDNEHILSRNHLKSQLEHDNELLRVELTELHSQIDALKNKDQQGNTLYQDIVFESGKARDQLKDVQTKYDDLTQVFNALQQKLHSLEEDNAALAKKYADAAGIIQDLRHEYVPKEVLKPMTATLVELENQDRDSVYRQLGQIERGDGDTQRGTKRSTTSQHTPHKHTRSTTQQDEPVSIHPLSSSTHHGPRLESIRRVFDLQHLHTLHSQHTHNVAHDTINSYNPQVVGPRYRDLVDVFNRSMLCMKTLYLVAKQVHTIVQLYDRRQHPHPTNLSAMLDEIASYLSHACNLRNRGLERLQSLERGVVMEFRQKSVASHCHDVGMGMQGGDTLHPLNIKPLSNNNNCNSGDSKSFVHAGVSPVIFDELSQLLQQEELYLPMLKTKVDDVAKKIIQVFDGKSTTQSGRGHNGIGVGTVSGGGSESKSTSQLRSVANVMRNINKTHPNVLDKENRQQQQQQQQQQRMRAETTSSSAHNSARGNLRGIAQNSVRGSARGSARSAGLLEILDDSNRGVHSTNTSQSQLGEDNAVDSASVGLKSGEEQLFSSLHHLNAMLGQHDQSTQPHNYSSHTVTKFQEFPLIQSDIKDYVDKNIAEDADAASFVRRAKIAAGEEVVDHAGDDAIVHSIPDDKQVDQIYHHWNSQAVYRNESTDSEPTGTERVSKSHHIGVNLGTVIREHDPQRYSRREYY